MRLSYLRIVLCAMLIPALHGSTFAQADRPAFQPKVKPELELARAEGAARIDGHLDDALWATAARVTGFTEVQPMEMTEPLVQTEAFATYDENYLYVAFRAHDDPASVRATLSNRDQMFNDDWVGIILDTFGDAVRAYEIFVNPLGVQGDLLMTSNGEEPGFDLIFDSAGRLTSDGYQVEMAIPFGSLRFPSRDAHEWKITFLRNHPREARHIYSWAAVTRDDPCLLCQAGTLRGVENIRPATKAEIMPAVVGTHSGSRSDANDPASSFDNGRFHPQASLTMRYNLSSSLSAEGAVNPDFSQVESDAAQIDVNSTFALFYPERRPFFQEGTDLFRTYMDVIYTRSINDPIGAAKMNGNFGPTSIAFISAVDMHTPLLLPFEEHSELVEAGRSLSNILRARRTFGETTFLGGTITDRRLLDGGSGSVVSADFKAQFWNNYVIQVQAAVSRTQESTTDADVEDVTFGAGFTSALDGEEYGGRGSYVGLERRARHWTFDLSYRSASPTFRAANGFVTRNAYRTIRMNQSYDMYPKAALVDRVTAGITGERGYDFDGHLKRQSVSPQIMGLLTGQTFFLLSYTYAEEVFRDTPFEGLGMWTAGMQSHFSRLLSANVFVSRGHEIARFQETPEIGRQLSVHAGLDVKPTQRLKIAPSVQFAALHNLETHAPFYHGYIVRVETAFQFTRELSSRLILQYNEFDGRLDVEPLISYKVNPFSIFYVGSSHDYVDFGAPYRLTPTSRQLFFKFQYLLRR